MNLIELKCKNCGAKLEVNKDLDKFVCNFCGTENFIDDEASELRRVEDVKLESRKKNHEQTLIESEDLIAMEVKKKQALDNYKKEKRLMKWTVSLLPLTILFAYQEFQNERIASGIVAVIQSVLFAGVLLMSYNVVKEPFKNCMRILATCGFLLIILFMILASGK